MSNTFAPQNFDPVAALSAVASAAKPADPQTVMASVGAAKSVHEAIVNGQATVMFGNAVRMHDTLTRMQPSAQAQAWQAMTQSERASLSAIGYHPPATEALSHIGGGGLFGHIWGSIASGFHTAADWAKRGAMDSLNALGAPLRAVQHLNRAAHVLAETGEASAHGWTAVYGKAKSAGFTLFTGAQYKYMFDPGQWAKAWRQTQTGNRSLDPAIARHLNRVYGVADVQLATRVAGSASTTAFIQALPANQRKPMIQKLQTPKFRELLTQIPNARMSVGRFAVGSKFLNEHPEAGKLISDALDATYDFAATPLRVVGKASEAARIARYGLTNADVGEYLAGDASKVDTILRSSSVQRYVSHVGSLLQNGDVAALGRFDPMLETVGQQLADQGVNDAESFGQWLSGEAGLGAVLRGDVAREAAGVAIMPHLTLAGWLGAGTKEALQSGLDRLIDGKVGDLADHVDVSNGGVDGEGDLTHQHFIQPRAQTLEHVLSAGRVGGGVGRIPGISNVARLVRQMTTLIATKPYIDIGTDADLVNLRRAAQGVLPARRVDDVVNIFAHADQGVRYRIVAALRRQMMHAYGLYNTPEGQKAADDFLAAVEDGERKQAYSVDNIDMVEGDNGIASREALLPTQLNTKVHLPMPGEVRRLVAEHSMLSKLRLGTDWSMYLWRSMVLDRLGFAVRVALTEGLGRLLRTGPRKFLGSFLAEGAMRTRSDQEIADEVAGLVKTGAVKPAEVDEAIAARKALAIKPVLPYHPIERLFAALGDRVPEGIRPMVDTPAKFYGAVAGVGARRFVRAAQRMGLKALGLETYIDAATRFYTHQPVSETYRDMIDFGHGTEGYMWTPEGQIRAIKDNATGAMAMFRAGVRTNFSEATGHDPLWRFKWQFALDQVAHDQLGQAVLDTLDKSTRTQERAVLRVLEDPEFADTKVRFSRDGVAADGRRAGIDATQQQTDRDWARRVVRHVNTLLRSSTPKNGTILHDLVTEMRETGRGPSEDTLNAIPQRDLPASVFGPDLVQIHTLENFLSKSFEHVVGKPANWLTRQPAWIAAYTEAEQEMRSYAEHVAGGGDRAEKLLSDLATQRAFNKIIPYIHNPTLRTQFEDFHRTLFPFLFAQRQFIQRWGRTVLESPDTIRKIQLSMNGLRSMGFIRKDQNGNTYFYYPASQYPQELITKVLTSFGVKATVPMVVPFTGEVRYLIPGLDNPVTPSVGPFATVGMKELAKVMPELNGFDQAVLQQGATTPSWQAFTPTVFNRLWNALGPQQAGSELSSTMMQAIKYLDAAGYTPGPHASPAEREQYLSRVENWARTLLVMRAGLGFALPATPTPTLDPKHLSAAWHSLLNELPYNTAAAEYVKLHPDATAYTVGETQGESGGYTPATAASLAWMNGHIGFVRAHPLAAAWFVPRTGNGFTPAAYREQIALGMRKPKTMPTFLNDVIMARASNTYYATLQQYERDYTATTTSQEHQKLVNWWNNWKASFFKRNPIFGNYVASAAGHIRRQQTLEDLQQALTTPNVPESPLVPELRSMLDHYNQFSDQWRAVTGLYSTTSTTTQRTLQSDMLAWGNSYAKAHPQVADFWSTVLVWEVYDVKDA